MGSSLENELWVDQALKPVEKAATAFFQVKHDESVK